MCARVSLFSQGPQSFYNKSVQGMLVWMRNIHKVTQVVIRTCDAKKLLLYNLASTFNAFMFQTQLELSSQGRVETHRWGVAV